MIDNKGLNQKFQIYNGDDTPFEGLILHKSVVDSVVMSLGDNITGDVYYKNNALNVTMNEYIVYKGVKYVLVNPPTILREGMVKDNGELKGMTKYSFTFYHPMYQLGNMPFCDVAVSSDQQRYLSENKTFSWIGYPDDYIAKLNKNLDGTEWIVEKSSRFPALKDNVLSEVLSFENNTIADALKTFYDTWEVPYVVDVVSSSESSYAQGKRFKVVVGLPSNEIYASESDKQLMQPYVFKMGQGVGLKNNSRTPRNNKIITRISGYGSEDNIPYGYPQIVWDGEEDDPRLRYPLYDGIVGGRYVKLIKHPFTRTHLMPSIYSETVNKKVNPNAVGYDPTIELKDYYDAITTQEYPYVNEINPLAPSYESHQFDVKPEMNDGQSSVEILDAIPLNADLTPAESWDDTMDGDGNYLQSYFQITLPQLSFDLYACAAITQEMSINMRGGACIGCTFPIQVNWDDYKANFYDQDGNFAPDGEQRDLTKYPKSNLGSISVVVQKEYQTFGTIMPNVFQQPNNGDEFVVLGISLPSEYISNAEERLDGEMKSYMLENNIYYFDYPLKFDEYFLATHTYILEQLKPNSVVRFEFAGNELQLFVKQLTIKYSENVLPQYDITLTDNVEVVLNQIGQVAEDVERLSSVISILRESYGRNVWTELSKKLSKVNDDTAQGFIRFIKGLQVGERFVSGLLGEGAVFRKDVDGTTYLEADKMYVRMKAYFDTVEIRKYLHSAGNRVASDAGAKCIRVEYIDADGNVTSDAANAVVFRCYFRGSDGDDEVTNDFLVGDQVYCHITNGSTQSLQMHHYWRLLVGRNAEGELTEDGEHWIDLSNRPTETVTIDGSTYTHAGYQTGSDIPVAQDDMVQLGNISDKTRQGAIVEYVSGADSPSYQIYQGIDDFSLDGKNQLALGYNTQTGRAYLNVYGDAYIGDRNGSSYIRYNTATKKLEIKAEVNIQSTFDGKTLPDYIAEHSSDWTEEEITALFTDDFNNIDAEIKNIQKQVDGSIETWFYNGVPSSSVLPESEWKAKDIAAGNNNERLKHLGDLYYDNQSGYAYRYTNQGTESVPQFVWTQISDSAVIKALENAAKAQDTADHKRRVFVRQPLDSEDYDVGDLWVNATYPSGNTQTDDANGRYYNDILKCIKHKDKNVAFSISDWGLSSKYTDDSALDNFKASPYVQLLTNGTLSQDIENAQQAADDAQADADAAAAAAANAKTAADNAQADATAANNRLNGWANDGSISPTEKTSLKLEWENVKKEYIQICNDADKYGVSKTVFANAYSSANSAFSKYTAATPENITIGSDYDNIAAYYDARQTILDAITQAAKKVATDAATAAANAQAKADSAYALAEHAEEHAGAFDYVKQALHQDTDIINGLVLTTLIALRDKNDKIWSGINGAYQENETGSDFKGHGIASWYGGAMVDKEVETTADDYAKSLFRFDGSGYLAGGNITWNANGAVTIKNITTLSDSQNTNLLNELATFNNAFSFATSGSGSTTVLSITPNVPFTALSILDPSVSPNAAIPVATQKWVSDNYVSIEFFKRLFQAHNGSANVNPNDSGTTITDIEAMFGFWTNQYISALGKGSGGSGGGGVGDVTWDLLASNSDTRQIALSHLTGALSGYALTAQLSNYLPLSGGTITGNLSVNGSTITHGITNIGSTAYSICTRGITGAETNGDIGDLYINNNSGTSVYMCYSGGNVGIGTFSTGEYRLAVIGAIYGNYVNIESGNSYRIGGSPVLRANTNLDTVLASYSGTLYLRPGTSDDGTHQTLITTSGVQSIAFIKNNGTSSQFLKADGSVDSTSYLPTSGGMLSGGGADVLTINRTGANEYTWIRFFAAGSLMGYVGIGRTDQDFYFQSPTFETCRVWHSGNDGSGSGLDADLLDGQHASYFATASALSNYLPLAGGTMTGSISMSSSNITFTQNYGIYCGTAQVLRMNDNHATILSAYGNTIHLRPNGTSSGAGEVSVNTSGDIGCAKIVSSKVSISYSPTNSFDSSLAIVDNTITTSHWPISALAPSAAVGARISIVVGKSTSTYESALFSYYHAGAESSSNYVSLGMYNAADLLCVQASGKVGIGTTSPSHNLDINGDLLVSKSLSSPHWVSDTGQVVCHASGTNYYLGIAATTNGYGVIQGGNSGTGAIPILINPNDGNVGIATISPLYKLHVNGSGYYDGILYTNQIINLGTTGKAIRTRGLDGSTADGSQESLYINNNHNGHVFICAGGGNVGIGSNSASYKLQVNGTFYASGDTTLGGILSMGNNQRIYFKNTSGAGVSALLMDTSNNFVIGEGMTAYNTYLRGSSLTFQTGSSHTDRMTIDANGRVYVVNGSQGLRIGDALLTWDSTNNAIKVSAVNGSGQVNFYATGGVSALGVGGSGSSSGGIDAEWLKNNDVQIKRLGIGVAPSSSYQLNVQGASNFTGAVAINNALTVNSSVSAIGGFSTSQGSISAAHDITAGGNGLVYNRLTVGKTSVDTSYIFYVNGSACVTNGIYLASNVYIKHSVPASGVTLCNITAPSGLTVNGSTSWSSDMRKKDVVSYVNELDVNKVAKAPVFRFTWKDKRDSVVRVGTSAQYWQNALANSVMDMGEYGLMLDYNAITIASAVVTARKVVDHELHIKQLEERVRELESEIKQLKAA